MRKKEIKMSTIKTISVIILLLAMPALLPAQSRNNEDEVVKIERYAMRASVPNQLLVKFHDYSDIRVDATRGGKRFVSATKAVLPINQVLEEYEVDDIQQLVPNFVMSATPRRSRSYGGADVVEHDLSQIHLIVLSDNSQRSEHELIEALNALDEVEFAEPNYICYALGTPAENVEVCDATAVNGPRDPRTPRPSTRQSFVTNDPMYSLQWGFTATKLDSLLMQPKLDSTAPRKIIAFLDTGVDVDHPDLAGNIWTNPEEQNGTAGQDDDQNGFADDIHGWDFVNQSGLMRDNNSHGTHCAGIAAAVGNNGVGITGANPNALIMPVTVLQSDGTGSASLMLQGVNYAAQNGADVISMSIGMYTRSLALEQALGVAYQNSLIVAAAGNDGAAIDIRCADPPVGQCFPAALTFVIGVQATTPVNYKASFSNWDCDGPIFSQFNEEQLYNYEISAPGVSILSTVPNGQYRYYNGTSMACPLVAGGLSALMERREYVTKEVLFAEMIQNNEVFRHINFMNMYEADSMGPARFQCVAIEVNDTLYGDGSMYADAGEHIQLYPTLRNVWGNADSIRVWVEFQEFEDTSVLTSMSGIVDFGLPLSTYAKAKSVNPIDMTIRSGLANGRHISLTLCATSPTADDTLRHDFVLKVTNGVKIGGMITGHDTLWPNVEYIVTRPIVVAPNATLFIKPGTTLKFNELTYLGSSGKITAIGTPDSMITFTKTDACTYWGGLRLSPNDTLSYCILEYLLDIRGNRLYLSENWSSSEINHTYYKVPVIDNAIIRNNSISYLSDKVITSNSTIHNNFLGDSNPSSYIDFGPYDLSLFHVECFHNGPYTWITHYGDSITNNNFCHNSMLSYGVNISQNTLRINPVNCNIFDNVNIESTQEVAHLHTNSTEVWNTPIEGQLYLGSGREDIVRKYVYDLEHPGTNTFGRIDLTNMATQPVEEAHGVVWKVEVQGHDLQDEFDSIMPLGVGTHEFKVYFNRAMDTSVTPMLAMGIRPPYTQTAIMENNYWSSDRKIWTSHLTLTGREAIDGLNRIYVSDAKDDEHFEIPTEDLRFNVQVASSGAMSLGFQATPGIGKVDLEWNNQETSYEDFLGFNLYRYQYEYELGEEYYDSELGWVSDTIWTPTDTLRINPSLLQDTTYTDYNVIPGVRYYYYYRILNTSLTENSPSKTVSCIPLSTVRGDANGSYVVDIADVITVINYMSNQNPKPFLFGAADVNEDGVIDVLDVVGIINIILYGNQRGSFYEQHTAIYTIEDEVLYVESPVALAGFQFTLENCTMEDIEVLDALNGFELVNAPIGDNDLMLMAFSMSGMQVPAGKHALLRIGDKAIDNIVLSDPEGNNVMAVQGDGVGITDVEPVPAQIMKVYPNPFEREVNIMLDLGEIPNHYAQLIFMDMIGRQVCVKNINDANTGQYSYTWNAAGMSKGVYFVVLNIDGIKTDIVKLILK